jgi:hypothetical protein
VTLGSLKRYGLNYGLLLLRAVAWNLALTQHLPAAFQPPEFWREIPAPSAFTENCLRIAVFTLPFLMPLDVATKGGMRGLVVFIAEPLVHFASWLALMLDSNSAWSKSLLGFAALAYSPLVWLFGIALLGQHLFWGTFFRRWMYPVLSLAFLRAHVSHAALVFSRNQ